MTTASWALRLPLPHSHIWCNGGGGRGASEVPRAKAAIEGPTEGTGALWFGSASLQGWNSGEARKWGGEVRAFWKDKWGGGAWGREGTHPALGPRGVRWPWPPPTLLFLPALRGLPPPCFPQELEIPARTQGSVESQRVEHDFVTKRG